ncbi:hypothetical protein [Desulfitobacterium sp.]|uniref:hypothetical protein n=1 Tax=Desulfitobacterium sp. TaxID=49981 RepID=UPI002C9A8714|nr:hypothetical protein [Desulfitobacterium sp.]HVJ48756.1 hypothetical protein [Desulfitobacterium sp.]
MEKLEKEFETYPLEEYPDVENIKFPKELYVAHAVCGKECGAREFIVDGQTQVCQHCGKLMFRTEVKKYILTENE